MKTRYYYLKNLVPIIFLILFVIPSCKEKPSDPIPQFNIPFTVSKNDVRPLEVITVTFERSVDITSIKGMLGDKAISLNAVNDKLFSFYIPESLPPQVYKLSFGGVEYKEIKVNSLIMVKSSDDYLNDFNIKLETDGQKIKNDLKSLSDSGVISSEILDKGIRKIDDNLRIMNQSLAISSLSQKERAAKFIESNRSTIDSLVSIISDYDVKNITNGRVNDLCSTSSFTGYLRCKASTLFAISAVYALSMAIMVSNPEPLEKAILIYAIGFATVKLRSVMLDFFKTPGIFDKDLDIQVTNNRVAAINFDNNEYKKVSMKIPVRNFQEDLDGESSTIEFKSVVLGLKGIRVFSGITKLLFDFEIPDNPIIKEYRFPDELSKLQISDVSNSSVLGKVRNLDGDFFEVGFSTTEKKDQNFDFSLVYQVNDDIVTKKMTENVLKVSSNTIYEGVVGKSGLLEILGNPPINCHTQVHFTNLEMSVEMKSGSEKGFVFSNLKATFNDLNLDPACSFNYPPLEITFQPNFFEYLGGDDLKVNFFLPGNTSNYKFFADFEGKFNGTTLSGILTIRREHIIPQYSFSLDIPIVLTQNE